MYPQRRLVGQALRLGVGVTHLASSLRACGLGGGEEQAKALPVKPWLKGGRRGATRAVSYRGRA